MPSVPGSDDYRRERIVEEFVTGARACTGVRFTFTWGPHMHPDPDSFGITVEPSSPEQMTEHLFFDPETLDLFITTLLHNYADYRRWLDAGRPETFTEDLSD